MREHISDITEAVLVSIINAKRRLNQEIDYHSATWTQISFAVKLRDGYKCRQCGARLGLRVHHINPLNKGGTHLPSNLITLCRHCHSLRHKK